MCRLRGRLLPRGPERWRDIRDLERASGSLDADPDDEEATPALPDAPTRVRGSRGSVADAGPEPLAGDRVECRALGEGRGRIEAVLPRDRVLERPPVANCDHVLLVVSWDAPPFSPAFVDRVLIDAAAHGCAATICLNKADMLVDGVRETAETALAAWRRAGFSALVASAVAGEGLDAVSAALTGRLTVLAGPSGAGKSRLLQALVPERPRRSGELSARSRRGRHTTRAVDLLPLSGGGWVADTPGFSRLSLEGVGPEELAGLYPEFATPADACRFRGCRHASEPDCAVRAAAEAGELDAGRYARYLQLLAELESRRPVY